ncbi:MAG: hypothetical protein GX366_06910 [Epulopiscium sp.]|nr:hypothetical protein [Candidatus Epulonipiscium sp.]
MKILLVISIAAIFILFMNIKTIQKNPYISIRLICTILFSLSIMRYITLLLFAQLPSLELINKLKYFYYITIIGLTIPFIILIWYITPLYRNKIKPLALGIICLPHILFYISLIIMQPFKAIKSDRIGYNLTLVGRWPRYLAFIQLTYIIIYIILSIYGFTLYKHKQTRGQYLILIMCHILFLIDGLTYFGTSSPYIPVFTFTEVFGFLTLYYGFSIPTIDFRKIKKG